MERSDLAPMDTRQRIEVVDIIRGVALFGILLVNMSMFRLDMAPMFIGIAGLPGAAVPVGLWDRVAHWGIQLFAAGRFYPILAMLFGLGCYMIMQRAEQKGISAKPLLWRRLLLLLVFGVLHYVFIWFGDILHVFAATGVFLLLFMRKSTVSLRKWIIGLSIVGLLVLGLLGGMLHWVMPLEAVIPEAGDAAKVMGFDFSGLAEVMGQGSYWAVVRFRAFMLPLSLIGLLITIPLTLIFFLIGLYAGKAGIVDRLTGGPGPFRRMLLPALIIGALGMGIATWMSFAGGFLMLVFAAMLGMIGGIGFVVTYISALVLSAQTARGRRLLRPFIQVGRMPLTTYLMQSVIATLLFYGYGLGLAGRVGAGVGVLLTIGIFAMQMLFSHLWFKTFAFGPAEWLWRRLMYRKKLSLRSAAS